MDEAHGLQCDACGTTISSGQKFCGACGVRVQRLPEGAGQKHSNYLKYSLGFYFILFFICVFADKIESLQEYPAHFIFDGIFALTAIVFVILNFREMVPLFSFKNVNWLLLITLVILIIPTAIGNSMLVDQLNAALLNEQVSYAPAFDVFEYKKLWMVLSIAVFPAVFEEISFRGFLFNFLQPLAGRKATVIVTAVLFSLMHLSLISFAWIFLFGLLLGWLRMKYNTIWYGVFLHFTFNLTVTIYEWIGSGMI